MAWINDEHRKRALKSFSTFIVECKSDIFHWKTGKYKCKSCYGDGRVVAPWAFNDPVEGYKMADKIDCSHCNGTGESNEAAWREIYRQEKASHTERMKKDRETNLLIKEALKKLSAEEIKVLGIDHRIVNHKIRK